MSYKIHPVKSHFLFWHDALGLKHKDAAGVRIQVRLIKLSQFLHFMVIKITERDFITMSSIDGLVPPLPPSPPQKLEKILAGGIVSMLL